MGESIFARLALTPDGWMSNARIEIDGGRIRLVTPAAPGEAAGSTVGIVIPGLANGHSHAFQRALAGHTEFRGPAGTDNFWTWRSRMYALAGKGDASRLTAIARQAYLEMVATGYTSVAEFHYLHSEPGEDAAGDAMYEAIASAARATGIRLTYVPVLYERSGFEADGPTPEQSRFALSADALIRHYERVAGKMDAGWQIGIGVHSLRAVRPQSLRSIAAIAERDEVPMHIHIAEQQREVDQCVAAHGVRPVEWLLDQCDVSSNWCLVHATHANSEELDGLVDTGAVVCLCPSTEANLGDGLFPLQPWLERGGRVAIGSDSHVSINPFEELRWLEYGQRLMSQSRNVAAVSRAETGRSLFEAAGAGGAQACGNCGGQIEAGADADLVVLDDDSPMLAGHDERSLLDALVFSGFTLPIDRVMVNGRWLVEEGRHVDEKPANAAYRDAIGTLDLQGLWK